MKQNAKIRLLKKGLAQIPSKDLRRLIDHIDYGGHVLKDGSIYKSFSKIEDGKVVDVYTPNENPKTCPI